MVFTRKVFIVLVAGLLSQICWGHGRYILPSHTILSGKEPAAVVFSASISNDIFHPDLPLGDSGKGDVPDALKGLFAGLVYQIVEPDGNVLIGPQWRAMSRMSVAEQVIDKDGTYRIALVQPATPMTTFRLADGSPGRKFGKAPQLPEGATEIVRRLTHSRVETYVTKNTPNDAALRLRGRGLELVFEQHPNDLFVGETIQMALLFQGKPLTKTATIELIRGGTRHRNQRDVLEVSTDARGQFGFVLEKAGFYLLEADYSIPGRPGSEVDMEHHSLYLTLEVFPE